MVSISIRDLHLETGRWVRRAQRLRAVLVVTDRGRPVATLAPYEARVARRRLPDREAEIRKLPRLEIDTACIVSDMRERP
jgi:antitoxin (DNA-binding transcriptional repressor) of toxin-antitoxin stability system